jgi:hypothetical protein
MSTPHQPGHKQSQEHAAQEGDTCTWYWNGTEWVQQTWCSQGSCVAPPPLKAGTPPGPTKTTNCTQT